MNNEENWNKIKEELALVDREGVDELISFFEESDFRTAPASTKFHNAFEGGLMDHSLNVLRFAKEIDKNLELHLNQESIILASILHDICKINFYYLGWEWDKEAKDKTGKWEKKDVYKINDNHPLGHGEKSAIIAAQFLDLMPHELAAIRWHMLAWDVSESAKYTLRDAMEKFPLLKVIALADQMAELYETTQIKT